MRTLPLYLLPLVCEKFERTNSILMLKLTTLTQLIGLSWSEVLLLAIRSTPTGKHNLRSSHWNIYDRTLCIF
jgi:hypothetical protein